MNEEQIQEIANMIWAYLLLHGPRVLFAILFLVIGLWLIRLLTNILKKYFDRKDFEPALETFLLGFMKIALRVILIIAVISMMGFETTSFVAILGAAGLAVGLSLQGSLANFAGGVLILVFKPFKVGDYIDAQGQAGTVREVGIMYTTIHTPQNQKVVIPNGVLSNGPMLNYSSEPVRRLDLIFNISYTDDIRQARQILEKLAREEPQILPDPAPFIGVAELGASSVDMVLQVWVSKENALQMQFDLKERVKLAFDEAGITIPFPQQVVYMHQQNT